MIAIAEVISQKYCSLDDALFRIDITLHLRFENRTDKVLILDKQFGKFPSRRIIAKSRESLALRDYEVDPLFDSLGEDPPHFTPSMGLLRSNFILLAAGQSFESDTTVDVFVWHVSKPDRKGAINYGDHALQMGFLGWSYTAKASQFEQAWRNSVNSSRKKSTQSPSFSRYQETHKLKRRAIETGLCLITRKPDKLLTGDFQIFPHLS